MIEPPHLPLCKDRVRHVGDQVALVVAETYAQAKDAAEQINVTYKELPAIISTGDADKAGKPQVWAEAKNNTCFDWHLGDKAATDAAFAKAHHVTKIDIVNQRLIPNAMEPRAAVGDYDRATGEYTLYTTSQNPHVIRLLMGAFVLQIPEHKLRVVAPDVGGGFGSKIFHYAEEALVTWAAGKVQPPDQVDGGPQRGLHLRRARPRPRQPCRAGDGQGRQVPGPAGQHDRQHGRVSVDLRTQHSDLSLCHAAGGRVHDAGDLCRGEGGVHQHRAGRRLSRRRPAGSDLSCWSGWSTRRRAR